MMIGWSHSLKPHQNRIKKEASVAAVVKCATSLSLFAGVSWLKVWSAWAQHNTPRRKKYSHTNTSTCTRVTRYIFLLMVPTCMHVQLSKVQLGGCGFTHSEYRKTPLMFVIHFLQFELKQQLCIAVVSVLSAWIVLVKGY